MSSGPSTYQPLHATYSWWRQQRENMYNFVAQARVSCAGGPAYEYECVEKLSHKLLFFICNRNVDDEVLLRTTAQPVHLYFSRSFFFFVHFCSALLVRGESVACCVYILHLVVGNIFFPSRTICIAALLGPANERNISAYVVLNDRKSPLSRIYSIRSFIITFINVPDDVWSCVQKPFKDFECTCHNLIVRNINSNWKKSKSV